MKNVNLTLIDSDGSRTELTAPTDIPTPLPRLKNGKKTFIGWNKYSSLDYGFMNCLPCADETLYAIYSCKPTYVLESCFMGDINDHIGMRSQFRRYMIDVYLENSEASYGELSLDNCNTIFYYIGNVAADDISVSVDDDTDIHGGAYNNAAYFTTSKIKISWKRNGAADNGSKPFKIARIMLAFSRFGLGYNEVARRTSDELIMPSHGYVASAGSEKACVSANFHNGVIPEPLFPNAEDDENVFSAPKRELLPNIDKGELLSRFAVLADSHVGKRYNWANYDWLFGTYESICNIHKATPLDFVLQLGDNIDDGYDETYHDDYAVYLDTIKKLEICDPNNPLSHENGMIPNYEMQGNHDVSDDTRFFKNKLWYSENQNGKSVAYIGFFVKYKGYPAVHYKVADSYESYRSYGIIWDEVLDFVEESIKEAKARGVYNIVLCSHFGIAQDLIAPILPESGLGKIDALCRKYDIKLYLSGHEHNIPYTLRKYGSLYNYDASMTKDKYAVYEIWENCIITEIYDTETQKICRADMIKL